MTETFRIVASHDPKAYFCLEEFKTRAEKFMIFLIEKYPWFNQGTYVHIGRCSKKELESSNTPLLAYLQEIIVLIIIFLG